MGKLRNSRNNKRQRRVRLRHLSGDILILYKLEEEKVCANQGLHYDITYSITVTKIDCGGSRREVERLFDVTRDEEEALRIFDIISRCLVTPCTAGEIVSDLIGI